MSKNKVEIEDCICIAETEKAILVENYEGEEFWLPKSVIDDDSEVYKLNTSGILVIPEWFAKQNGIIS